MDNLLLTLGQTTTAPLVAVLAQDLHGNKTSPARHPPVLPLVSQQRLHRKGSFCCQLSCSKVTHGPPRLHGVIQTLACLGLLPFGSVVLDVPAWLTRSVGGIPYTLGQFSANQPVAQSVNQSVNQSIAVCSPPLSSGGLTGGIVTPPPGSLLS